MASLNQVSIELQVTGEREVDRALKNVDSSVVKNVQTAQRLERQYAQLDKAFNSGKISAQMYAKGVQQVDRAIDQAYAGSAQFEKQVRQTTRALDAQSDANHFASRRMNGMGMATQQVGYQVGDFLVQVQSGTNAFVAFGQQATQLVGILPLMADSLGVSAGKLIAVSSALGIIIPLATAFGAALARTGGGGQIFEDLAFAIEPIQPLLDALAVAMSTVADVTIDFVNLLVNNLDRIVVAATVVAGFFAAKWVAAFIAAGKATLVLNGALNLVRATLLRLPFIALIVGATELIYQFTQLVKGAGGFGTALGLLKDVAVEVFDRIKMSFGLVPLAIKSGSNSMAAFFISKLNSMLGAFIDLTWSVAEGLNNLFGSNLMGADATITQSLALVQRGFEDTASSAKAEMDSLSQTITAPIESLDALQNALNKANEEGRNIDVRDWFGGMGGEDSEDGSGGSGKGATDRTKDALTELQEKVQSVADTIENSMSEAFMSMVEGTKSVKDAFKDMARAIIKELYDVLVVQQLVGSFDAKTGTGSGLVGSIMGAVGGLFGGGNAFGGTSTQMIAGGGLYANGNAFNAGRVVPFADGGVVSSPTTFPMAGRQTGLMGEAGPEAIMPLKRGKGGKLGVVAEGGGQQPVVIHQNFNFAANGDESVKKIIAQEAPKIANLTQKQILDQRARGGAFRTTFG